MIARGCRHVVLRERPCRAPALLLEPVAIELRRERRLFLAGSLRHSGCLFDVVRAARFLLKTRSRFSRDRLPRPLLFPFLRQAGAAQRIGERAALLLAARRSRAARRTTR